jgi:signal transduction histidine kinase
LIIFESNLNNSSILIVGNKDSYEKKYYNILNGIVKKVYFVESYKEALNLIKSNEVDVAISNLESDTSEDIFLQIKYINQYVTTLLVVPRDAIELIELATIYGVDNIVLDSLDKDTFIQKLDKLVTIIFQRKELSELTSNLENRVREEIEKNREKDKMMMHQSRLAAMGEMIGNISHQWRQPLAALNATLDSITFKKRLGKLTQEHIEQSIESSKFLIEQMNQTIDDFRNFFKPNKTKNKFLLSKVINKNLKMMDGVYKNFSIQAIVKISIDLEVLGYENELSQAILNILNNSKDVLSSKTHKKYVIINLSKDYITDDLGISRECMKLTIKDNGGGIPEDIVNKIFEPYFTTKHQAQGTGIGLYMTKQIIENSMYGKVDVKNVGYDYDSERYLGAEFTIKLPL